SAAGRWAMILGYPSSTKPPYAPLYRTYWSSQKRSVTAPAPWPSTKPASTRFCDCIWLRTFAHCGMTGAGVAGCELVKVEPEKTYACCASRKIADPSAFHWVGTATSRPSDAQPVVTCRG